MQSGDPSAKEIILSNMAVAFDRVLLDVEVLACTFIVLRLLFKICMLLMFFINSLIALYILQDPFSFLPCHKAIREPFDYYMFGQNYLRPLIDFRCFKIHFAYLLFNLLFHMRYVKCPMCFWTFAQNYTLIRVFKSSRRLLERN